MVRYALYIPSSSLSTIYIIIFDQILLNSTLPLSPVKSKLIMISKVYLLINELLVATISFRPYRQSKIAFYLWLANPIKTGLTIVSTKLIRKLSREGGQWKVSKLMHFSSD